MYSASEALRELLGVPEIPASYAERYNVAVSDPVLIARQADAGGAREAAVVRWSPRRFNARSETTFSPRRCLIAANGFYEWETKGKIKQPWYFHFADGRPFAFAGIWNQDGATILTGRPNELVERFHDRMPVIVRQGDFTAWLDPAKVRGDVERLFEPFPAEEMAAHSVGTRVNNVRNQGPELIAPEEPVYLKQGSLL